MELTYQSPMMPAAYSVISAEEMTYIDGGAFTLPTLDDALVFGVSVTFNLVRMIGEIAFSNTVDGLKNMHNDGLSLTQSVKHYWNNQTNYGRVATVIVGTFAGYYVYTKAMQIFNTVKNMYTDFKNAYDVTKAQQAAAKQQSEGLADPIVAAAA